MKVMCIGGPFDGRTETIKGSPFVVPDLPAGEDPQPYYLLNPGPVKLVTYRVHEFISGKDRFLFAAPEGKTPGDILRQLMSRYGGQQ